MPFPKNSLTSTSAPDLGELLRMQLQHESRSSAPDNTAEESAPLLYSGVRSFTVASEQVRMQRQLQQSSVPGNAESDYISSSSGLRSFTATDGASHPSTTRTRSLDTLRSILNHAIAVIDDEDPEDIVISSRRDDFNPQQ
jgi:hypothetical protein